MKGLVLSGGKGTRLRPLTYTSAKQLIPVANKPVLVYCLDAMREANIQDVGIVVGDTKKEIIDAVGDGSRYGLNVSYIEQDAPLGLAHAVMVSEDFIGNDRFVMMLGDNLIMDGISRFVDSFDKDNANSHILLSKVENPNQFGVAVIRDEKVVDLIEKPKEYISDLALVGVYLFDEKIFEAVQHIQPSFRGELEITDAIAWLIKNGYTVSHHLVSGWWKDTGKLEDILEANRMVLDQVDMRIEGEIDEKSSVELKVIVEKGVRIINSRIRGPAIIGSNSVIEDSYIGPFTAISTNCVVKGVEIEQSIVMDECEITDAGARISDSLLGKNVIIRKTEGLPKTMQIMAGDSSMIIIP
jgi:glucose-1-phosphate thymidylyltransferase